MLIPVFIILGSFLLVVQSSVLTLMPKWIGSPDLLFLLVLFIATKMGVCRGIILATIYGLMVDVFSGVTLGLFPVVYLGLFVIIKYLNRHILIDEPAHQPLLAALSYLACSGAVYLCTAIFSLETTIYWGWRDLLLQMFILAILVLPVFQVFNRLILALDSDQGRFLFLRKKPGNRFIS